MLGHLSSDAAYLRAVLDKGAHQWSAASSPRRRLSRCNYGARHAPSWFKQQAQAHAVVGLALPWLFPIHLLIFLAPHVHHLRHYAAWLRPALS
jgi:hypothetical protein